MNLYGVYGASGFGREIMPLLRAQVAKDPDAQCVFVDDAGADDTLSYTRKPCGEMRGCRGEFH